MAYGNNPAGDTTDAVRFRLGGASSDSFISDAEIDYLYATYGNVLLAAYHGSLAIAAKFSGEYDLSLSELSVSASQVQEQYAKRAADLLKEYNRSVKGSYRIPTISRTHDSLDFPDILKHSDRKPDRWFKPERASSEYDYNNLNE